jgi:hypothetical protein
MQAADGQECALPGMAHRHGQMCCAAAKCAICSADLSKQIPTLTQQRDTFVGVLAIHPPDECVSSVSSLHIIIMYGCKFGYTGKQCIACAPRLHTQAPMCRPCESCNHNGFCLFTLHRVWME